MRERSGLPWLGTLLVLGCTPRPTADIGQTSSPDAVRVHGPESAGEEGAAEGGPQARWIDLSIESEFGCAVERTGGVFCWGRGPAAEMGLRELPTQPKPDPRNYYSTRKWGPPSRIEMVHDATRISTASSRACAVVEDGRIRCWGSVRWGSQHVYDVAGVTKAVDVEISDGESCALLEDGSLWCWGYEDFGVPRPRLEKAVAMTVGDNIACGLTAQGDVLCWGQGVADWHRYDRQFNQPQPGPSPGPVPAVVPPEEEDYPDTVEVGRFRGAVDLEIAGWNNLCILRSDGRALCSERDLFSLLRGEDMGMREVSEVSAAKAVATSRNHNCVIASDGKASCWGRNVYGQLGDGSSERRETATPVVDLQGVLALSLSDDLSCAATGDDSIYCWGFDRGEAMAREDIHVHTLTGVRAQSLAVSGRTSCIVDDKQSLRCWGSDMIEQYGIAMAATPVDIGIQVGKELQGLMSSWESCFLGVDGRLQCGTWNYYGMGSPAPSFVVNNTTTEVLDLAAGPPPLCTINGKPGKTELRCGKDLSSLEVDKQFKQPTAVSAYNMRACVIHDGGKVGCFGDLYYWDQQPPPREVAKIGGIGRAVDIVSSTYQDCALRSDGRVSCWVGRTESEWSADGRTAKAIHYRAQDPKDMGLGDVIDLAGGGMTLCALERRGKVSCWNDNPYGEGIEWFEVLEIGEDIVEISVGTEHQCARHKDGRVSCWGDDTWGQIGRVPSRVYLRPTKLRID